MPAVGNRSDWPRADARWSVAEDRKLEKLVLRFVNKGVGKMYFRWERVARVLERTPCGAQSRYGILKVVRQHQKADGKKV